MTMVKLAQRGRRAERRFWIAWSWIRHPGDNWHWRQKWQRRPQAGDQVQDCRYQIHTVTRFGETEDDLVFEDGSTASWMHCCGPVPWWSEDDGKDEKR